MQNYDLGPKELFEKLDRYYENNGFYERYKQEHYSTNDLKEWEHQIKPLLSCVNRTIEFYVSKVGKDAQISSKSQEIIDAIQQVYTWSNWDLQQDLAKRQLSLYGNLLIKVVANGEKVYFEIINPKYMTSFKTDNRKFLTEIRIDLPVTNENGDIDNYTEFWNKEYYSIWQSRNNTPQTPLSELQGLVDYGFTAEQGIDFVPFVLILFKDSDRPDDLGDGAVNHALDKIDEINSWLTRQSDLMLKFGKPAVIISAADKDSVGRFTPVDIEEEIFDDKNVKQINGNIKVDTIIPTLPYDQALNLVKFLKDEISEDLPETRYYSLAMSSQTSGTALRQLLSGAIDKAESMQKAWINGLVRLNKIAMTLASYWGFVTLSGSYEDGSYDHSIDCSEMFPLSETEKATVLKTYVDAGLPLPSAMRKAGFSESEIEQIMGERASEDQRQLTIDGQKNQNLANAMQNFNTGV